MNTIGAAIKVMVGLVGLIVFTLGYTCGVGSCLLIIIRNERRNK